MQTASVVILYDVYDVADLNFCISLNCIDKELKKFMT